MASETPVYGWRVPDGTDPVALFPTQMRDLASDIETTFDIRTSMKKIVLPNTGHTSISFDARGNGTPTVGASSLTIANIFSADYNVYRINWQGSYHSTGAIVRVAYGGVSTGYYGTTIYNRPSAGTPAAFTADNNNSLHTEVSYTTTGGLALNLEIYNPFQTGISTSIYSSRLEASTTGALGRYMGFVSSTASITNVTISFSAGTISTAGTLTIYGWNL